jgi:dTDP-4-dehydrorhamnose 3,5-epimerase
MPFTFKTLDIPGLVLVEPRFFGDARGAFGELYQRSAFAAQGIADEFIQDNLSRSRRGVLRGLHYQLPPEAQGKLVTVLRGEVLDVVVDIRRGSPAFGRWFGLTLSAESGLMLYVPPGFAHGYCALSDEADFLYKCTRQYAPALDRGIRWDDPEIGVRWPVADPILSPKDAALPLLRDAENPFVFGA